MAFLSRYFNLFSSSFLQFTPTSAGDISKSCYRNHFVIEESPLNCHRLIAMLLMNHFVIFNRHRTSHFSAIDGFLLEFLARCELYRLCHKFQAILCFQYEAIIALLFQLCYCGEGLGKLSHNCIHS